MDYYENKRVLLTGASSGLGYAILQRLANVKNCRTIAAVRNKSKMDGIISSLSTAEGVELYVAHLDLDQTDAVITHCISSAFRVFGGIDIVINCAGMGFRGLVKETVLETDRRILQVDYFAQVLIIKAIQRLWLESGASTGDIVQISSVQGFFGLGDRAPYSAAKHAISGFIDSLRVEIDSYPSRSSFRVINVCPGHIATSHSVNALTGDGSTYCHSDPSTDEGYDPAYVALELLVRASKGEREIVIAPSKVHALIYLRILAPSLCFRLTRNLFRQTRESILKTIMKWVLNRD